MIESRMCQEFMLRRFSEKSIILQIYRPDIYPWTEHFIYVSDLHIFVMNEFMRFKISRLNV